VAVSLPSHGVFWRGADGRAVTVTASAAPSTSAPSLRIAAGSGAVPTDPPSAPGGSTTLPATVTPSAVTPGTPGTPMAAPPTVVVTTAPMGPMTYTVQPGDTLSAIAAWFKLHGYGDLYAANAAVIGADPNLIRPGERITISSAGASVQAP
jgi:LysM repeat protein